MKSYWVELDAITLVNVRDAQEIFIDNKKYIEEFNINSDQYRPPQINFFNITIKFNFQEEPYVKSYRSESEARLAFESLKRMLLKKKEEWI